MGTMIIVLIVSCLVIALWGRARSGSVVRVTRVARITRPVPRRCRLLYEALAAPPEQG